MGYIVESFKCIPGYVGVKVVLTGPRSPYDAGSTVAVPNSHLVPVHGNKHS